MINNVHRKFAYRYVIIYYKYGSDVIFVENEIIRVKNKTTEKGNESDAERGTNTSQRCIIIILIIYAEGGFLPRENRNADEKSDRIVVKHKTETRFPRAI